METELLVNVQGNVQTLRNLWSNKVQEEQQLLKIKPGACRSRVQLSSKNVETILKKTPTIISADEQPIEQSPSVNDMDDFAPLPPPPPSIIFKEQAQSMVILKKSVAKMLDFGKKNSDLPNVKNSGIRHWHLARHVFRSGLIFNSSRRASDSILPLLMKTHIAQNRCRTDTLNSIHASTPFENLIDYLTYNNNNNNNNNNDDYLDIPKTKTLVKRTISDSAACIERNKLNDTIAQYETMMRHLKNHEKFMATYSVSSAVSPTRKSITTGQPINQNEEEIQSMSAAKSSTRSRQTQSLARSAGRTFTEFIMTDCLLSPVSKTPSSEPRRLSTVHAASQTDINEIIQKSESISVEEEANEVLKELDTAIENIEEVKENVLLTPNSEINVIVINPSVVEEAKPEPERKPLIQRLFEGKKTAYTSNDRQMESTRIPEELMATFEIAKKKCFYPTEEVLYSTKMIKIDRRGYKQHIRILSLTNERLYIITKKNPYPKEGLLFKDILGVTCTPRKDGFICVHTRETRDDRGDWIFLIDHPCEFVTQLFLAMKRNDNDDQFLKIKDKFEHTRRSLATLPDDCIIEARPSDVFRIAYENYEILAIYSP